jgi:hypothetical protein
VDITEEKFVQQAARAFAHRGTDHTPLVAMVNVQTHNFGTNGTLLRAHVLCIEHRLTILGVIWTLHIRNGLPAGGLGVESVRFAVVGYVAADGASGVLLSADNVPKEYVETPLRPGSGLVLAMTQEDWTQEWLP